MMIRAHFAVPLFLFIVLSACGGHEQDSRPVVKRDHAEISYTDSGGDGTTLLFVHGLYIDKSYWSDQVKYFSPDYRVVTKDLPGHGQSGNERPHWTLRGYAGDVYTIIKQLDLKNVILIGHSMGGDINLMAATYRPKNIAGFIGIDNFKNAATPFSKKDQKEIDAFTSALQKDFAVTNKMFVSQYLTSAQTPPEVKSRIEASFAKADREMGLRLMDEIFGVYKEEERLIPQLKVKMHLINVSNSPVNVKPLKKLAPQGYSVREIEGTSHYPMIENPAELNRLIRETVEQIARENDTVRT